MMQASEFQMFSDEALSPRGIALLGYQRTRHISRSAQKAWSNGNPTPLMQDAETHRRAIFDSVLGELHADHQHLAAALAKAQIEPKSVIDIGCGQALGDLFLLVDHDPSFLLIDIEETPEQYHFWAETGAGYASLAEAAELLRQNGAKRVRRINPRKTPEQIDGLHADLVISTLSCGFHYPIPTYLPIFQKTLRMGGAVVLDLRRSYADEPDEALETLFNAAFLTEIPCSEPKAARILFTAA
ncbi:hypothetical protein RPE78_06125 [Thioclava litoralis]|uniref:Methyltransferase domain-containing protein n=1 Tax=Thioclava litoralis TaxID=3076557 RepID=A0ABZ1E4F0_9RHOB|nr:hypothetical protein RPE78_06125 [Thioclava sp. FTW29]